MVCIGVSCAPEKRMEFFFKPDFFFSKLMDEAGSVWLGLSSSGV